MFSKKKLSSIEWFIFILISGTIILLNTISLIKTKDVNKKLKAKVQISKK